MSRETEETSPSVSARWPEHLLEKRLEGQRRKVWHELPRPFPLSLFQKRARYRSISFIIKASGLYGFGNCAYRNPKVTQQDVFLPKLPAAFDGFRILHLTDLHFDLDPSLMETVRRTISELDFDVCLMTGDFRDSLLAEGRIGVELSAKLASSMDRPVYASLGNHDIVEDVAILEGSGMRVLINESSAIETDRGQARLYIAGVDDPGFYKTHDIDAALKGVPQGACVVLMAHAPDCYAEAAAKGISLMLSGHTHGGQICLPGGFPLLSQTEAPRRMISGPWREGELRGYTSRGTGACGVAARFFCPGEIAVHTLRVSSQ